MTEWHRNKRKMKPFSGLLLCELNSAHCCWHTSLKGCLGVEKKVVLFLFKYYLLGERKQNELDNIPTTLMRRIAPKYCSIFKKKPGEGLNSVGGVGDPHVRGPGQISSATWSGWVGVLFVVSAFQRHRQEDQNVKMFLS